jgi:hypothetical protein
MLLKHKRCLIKNPCDICITKPICKYYCDSWFNWIIKNTILPLDIDIPLHQFLDIIGNYGPIKNYYQVKYTTLKTIKFQNTTYPNRLRVCLSVD